MVRKVTLSEEIEAIIRERFPDGVVKSRTRSPFIRWGNSPASGGGTVRGRWR